MWPFPVFFGTGGNKERDLIVAPLKGQADDSSNTMPKNKTILRMSLIADVSEVGNRKGTKRAAASNLPASQRDVAFTLIRYASRICLHVARPRNRLSIEALFSRPPGQSQSSISLYTRGPLRTYGTRRMFKLCIHILCRVPSSHFAGAGSPRLSVRLRNQQGKPTICVLLFVS